MNEQDVNLEHMLNNIDNLDIRTAVKMHGMTYK